VTPAAGFVLPPVLFDPSLTWNPADISGCTLSNGNLTATPTGSGGARVGTGTSSGKKVWEIKVGASGSGGADTVYAASNAGVTFGNIGAAMVGAVGVFANGNWRFNAGGSGFGPTIQNNAVIMIAADFTNALWWASSSLNPGNWNVASGPGSAVPGVSGGNAWSGLNATLFPCVTFTANTDPSFTINTGGPFVNTVPAGFSPMS
jgi:hypothetical protein